MRNQLGRMRQKREEEQGNPKISKTSSETTTREEKERDKAGPGSQPSHQVDDLEYLKPLKSLVEMNLTCLPYFHLGLLPKNQHLSNHHRQTLLVLIRKTERMNFRLAKRLRNFCEHSGITLPFVRGAPSLSAFLEDFEEIGVKHGFQN